MGWGAVLSPPDNHDDGDDDDNDGGFDDDNGGWLPQHLLLPAAQHEQAPEEGEIGA